MGEKVQEYRSTNCYVQNRQGGVKNSIGNGVAKEYMPDPWTWTKRGIAGGMGVMGEGGQPRKIGTTVIA